MDLEAVSDLCYLGSHISYNRSCEKDVIVRIGKMTAVAALDRSEWRWRVAQYVSMEVG